MKKILTMAAALLGMAMTANAQFKGIGYNSDMGQITARLGIERNALDLGFNLGLQKNSASTIGLSGTFLGHLQDWGPVDTYVAVGAKFLKSGGDPQIGAYVGFQPEVTLLDHIAVATRFGFDIPLSPKVGIQTFGRGISIVEGLNFTILF
jgi:hypothetical protein